MKMISATSSLLLLTCFYDFSNGFSLQPARIQSSIVSKDFHEKYSPRSKVYLNKQGNDDVVQVGSYNSNESRLKRFTQTLRERTDTFRAAGFYDDENNKGFLQPKTAGAKTNITLFLLALGYKWYRSVFINKVWRFYFFDVLLIG